ncbi:hypothetical protein [Kribbella sp. VKM Ac-2568]|uniref:hypothetical protein n=1 Tax=Kribbella sp. VKM Ac-2568 TaxID=2512219 RepID=UPI0010E3F5C6|nr:hypothetical protein [Kribbella sp. VKM Ac-2568]TCM49067.1 hypothetical protein EV648_103336 [Kribbella sp. VKM Ac-2568]
MWLIVVLVLVVAGLEWNRRRQPCPKDPVTRRTGEQDRDLERLLDELRAAAGRES